MNEQPTLPDHGGRCVSSLVPAVVSGHVPAWMPEAVHEARQVVLLVIDGLGWHQLERFGHCAPALVGSHRQRITTVAPSTTAAALASITTGVAPGEHGLVGYKVPVAGELLNCLRWTSSRGDARTRVPGDDVQPIPPFLGVSPTVITRAGFRESGFTTAHLRTGVFEGWHTPMGIATSIRLALQHGEPFVYAYYDGLDNTAHVHGFGDHYLDELAFVDHLVRSVALSLPSDAVLVVTADHGFVQTDDPPIRLDRELTALTSGWSGEARFLWLHARPGRQGDLLAAARRHDDVAWVRSVDQVLDEHWFGPTCTRAARERLGDVALVARADVAFAEPGGEGSPWMLGRHGSMTDEEMHVPLCVLSPERGL